MMLVCSIILSGFCCVLFGVGAELYPNPLRLSPIGEFGSWLGDGTPCFVALIAMDLFPLEICSW